MSPFLRRGTKPGLPVCLMLLCTFSAVRASAQTDEQRSGARAIATEGASAFKAGRYKDAVDLFAKAESLVHAPPHLLFLARSHAKLGQLVKAREAYLKILKEQLPPNAPVAFRDAQTAATDELKSIEPHIGTLTVNVSGAESARDLVLTIDGQPVSTVLVGVAQPIDPGEHQITARATGFRATPASVTIHDAERQSVNLTLVVDPTAVAPVAAAPIGAPLATTPAPAAGNPAPAAPPLTPEPASDASSHGSGLKIGAYVAFGVGAVGLGVGTLFALRSKSKRSDADSAYAQLAPRCPCSADDPDAKNVASLDDSARSAKTLSIVGFAVGGAGIATGVTLLVLGTQKSEAPQGASVQPWIGLGSAGVRGSF